jgi:phospholipid transport system substrate-binding protein
MQFDFLARRARRYGLAAGLLLLAAPFADSAEVDEALAVIERLHAALAAAAAMPEAKVEQRFEALLPAVDATHDLPYIARLSVRRYWRDWSEAEREAFVAAFRRHSVMTYASRFGSIGENTLEIVGSEIDGDRVEVHALINRADADAVTLDYLLQEEAGVWRIVNILADGVSDLAIKIDEYGRVLESGAVDDLVAYLDAQSAALQ